MYIYNVIKNRDTIMVLSTEQIKTGTEQINNGTLKELVVRDFRNEKSLLAWKENVANINWLKKKFSPDTYTGILDSNTKQVIIRLR